MRLSLTGRERLPRPDLWIVIAVLGSATIAGCGSTRGNHTSTVPHHSFLFSECMRANGVPNFPDPGPHGLQFPPGNARAPAFQGALNTCQKYLAPSGPPPPIPQSVRLQEFAFAECMRANGVPNFPDPNASGAIQFPIGDALPQSPAFQHAQNGPCRKYLSR